MRHCVNISPWNKVAPMLEIDGLVWRVAIVSTVLVMLVWFVGLNFPASIMPIVITNIGLYCTVSQCAA